MSMVDTFNDTLNSIRRYIYANAPEGVERLERLIEGSHYMPLEFRRDGVSCMLYVEVDSFNSDSFMDEQGNRWRSCKLTARSSWPSYGSVDVQRASRFIKLLTDVNVFADKLLGAFSGPILKLVETAEQMEARKRKAAEDKCRAYVQARIRANMKGMRVGQERQVECPDLLPIGEVTVCDGPRHYTARVTSNRAFFFMRTA